MAINPFDYVKAINEKKDVEHPYDYNPFLSNMSFSYSADTVMLANEMNRLHCIPPDAQFKFMFHAVRKGKRYSPWHKEPERPHLETVMKYYGCSKSKALQALQVLTQENIRDMIDTMDGGGR